MFFAASAWEPLLKYYYYDDDGLSTTEVSIFAVTMKLRPGLIDGIKNFDLMTPVSLLFSTVNFSATIL
ncbi:hypothetical protein EJD97_016277 [Solanum chilense]|uniref:Uncharacterized protein n=1 Tax=Solanum chilense TaxID=4083 RepID=A0A6N2B570_SOLCI|nr:hypothetical protein EJD97_016277 [Solanum chilense]